MTTKRLVSIVLVVVVAVAAVVTLLLRPTGPEATRVVYGISPYQDTILPIVAQEKGWYGKEGLNVDLRVLAWGDVMVALASGAVDVAIQNFNSFQAAYPNIKQGGKEVIFWHPLFVFKGAAIVVRPNSGLKPLSEIIKAEQDMQKALIATAKQLKGKTIIATQGTEMEQVVLRALEIAGLSRQDVTLVHAQPDEGLNAFLRGEGDAYSGGVTEQLKAYREGNVQLLSAADVGLVVVDGLVTTREFAEKHSDVLYKLLRLWYRTVQFIDADIDTNSKVVIDYLNKKASYQFDVEDYKFTWTTTEYFPPTPAAARKTWLDSSSPYYWKKAWDANNEYLIRENKIPKPVPYDVFWMETSAEEFERLYGAK